METLVFTGQNGFYNFGDGINAPENSLISPSENILYTKTGKPVSINNALQVGNLNHGGSRAFVLSDNLIGFLGNNSTTEKGTGNILQISNKDLWFVGSNVSNGVRVSNNFSSFVQIGGVYQKETLTVTIGTLSAGNFNTIVTGAYISGSPISMTTSLLGTETATQVAEKLRDTIRSYGAITSQYYVYTDDNKIIFKDKKIRANDSTLAITIQSNSIGVNTATSVNTQSGNVYTSCSLSVIPQIAKFNGTYFENPVQVGVAEMDVAPILELTTTGTQSPTFTGKLTGSLSARVAMKRGGNIGIASPPSNVVTASSNSVYCYIPPYAEDGSPLSDRSIVLYFTYTGRGSQAAHFYFPIEIPETKLNGYEPNGWETSVGNARLKVISQHESNINSRIVEIEYFNNDLLLLQPFEDYFALGSCKFLAQLGNVVCGIGTGENRTGFDVSYPNNREAYPVDWRDWFREEPVSISFSSEQGLFWVLGSTTVYQALWTGSQQQTAPVVIREITSKYGAIGEGASISVNGILYFLSKGKIPVRIDPNGNIDDKFGDKVINQFTNYNTDCQLGYDELTNTVYFINSSQNNMIGYQIDTDLWTTPIQTFSPSVDSTFTYNGRMHYCYYNQGFTDEYRTLKFDSDSTSGMFWTFVTNFLTGERGFNLKDIVELRFVAESLTNDTITIQAYKNYNTSSADTLLTQSITAGTRVTYRKLVESVDYETISLRVSGNKGGQTIHTILCTVDNRGIERGK